MKKNDDYKKQWIYIFKIFMCDFFFFYFFDVDVCFSLG